MSDINEETSTEYSGDYPEIAAAYKAGEELTDEQLDTIADVAISILRSIQTICSRQQSTLRIHTATGTVKTCRILSPNMVCWDSTSATSS